MNEDGSLGAVKQPDPNTLKNACTKAIDVMAHRKITKSALIINGYSYS